jgi:hypothetical protein
VNADGYSQLWLADLTCLASLGFIWLAAAIWSIARVSRGEWYNSDNDLLYLFA